MQEKNLTFKFQLPEEKVILRLDPQKTFRIFDNLYTNISKYAMPSTRVYVTVTDSASETQIAIRNISQMELTVSGEELTERFVRGDAPATQREADLVSPSQEALLSCSTAQCRFFSMAICSRRF